MKEAMREELMIHLREASRLFVNGRHEGHHAVPPSPTLSSTDTKKSISVKKC